MGSVDRSIDRSDAVRSGSIETDGWLPVRQRDALGAPKHVHIQSQPLIERAAPQAQCNALGILHPYLVCVLSAPASSDDLDGPATSTNPTTIATTSPEAFAATSTPDRPLECCRLENEIVDQSVFDAMRRSVVCVLSCKQKASHPSIQSHPSHFSAAAFVRCSATAARQRTPSSLDTNGGPHPIPPSILRQHYCDSIRRSPLYAFFSLFASPESDLSIESLAHTSRHPPTQRHTTGAERLRHPSRRRRESIQQPLISPLAPPWARRAGGRGRWCAG